MKRIHFAVAIILAFCFASSAKAQTTLFFPSGPLVWSAFIADSAFYTVGLPIVASFTPEVSIHVTRLEFQAAFGTEQPSPSGTLEECATPMAIEVTNGTTSFTLPLPNAPGVGSFAGPEFADSGPLNVIFPAGARITLQIVGAKSSCFFEEANITVQYKTIRAKRG